jgi:membrane protease YdiL (CAAX protease family)
MTKNERLRYWAVLLPALLLPSLAAVVYFVLMKQSAFAQGLYFATKVFELIWPFVAVGLILKIRPLFEKRPLAEHLRAVPLGLGIGLVIVMMMVTWMHSPLAWMIERGADPVKAKVAALGFENHFIPFAVFITVAHSLLEEIYWRWFAYGHLRRVVSIGQAHVIAAVAFTGHHLVVTSQFFPFGFACFLSFCVGIGGLIWSFLYQRQGTLAGAWICHLLVDAGLMWVGWILINLP